MMGLLYRCDSLCKTGLKVRLWMTSGKSVRSVTHRPVLLGMSLGCDCMRRGRHQGWACERFVSVTAFLYCLSEGREGTSLRSEVKNSRVTSMRRPRHRGYTCVSQVHLGPSPCFCNCRIVACNFKSGPVTAFCVLVRRGWGEDGLRPSWGLRTRHHINSVFAETPPGLSLASARMCRVSPAASVCVCS
jgi:hypothetical protein